MALRAYAPQMLATVGVGNTVIEATHAPRGAWRFLGPPWMAYSPFGGGPAPSDPS
jgi:hypothetical protein